MASKPEDELVQDLAAILGSDRAPVTRWSTHSAKDQFSRMVSKARSGEVQVVENLRSRDREPVVVLSVDHLKGLVRVATDERIADVFRPDPDLPAAERLLVRPQPRRTARIKL